MKTKQKQPPYRTMHISSRKRPSRGLT